MAEPPRPPRRGVPSAPLRPPPSPGRAATEKVYGLNASLAVFARRPQDIVRIAHTRDVRRSIAEMLRAAAARRVPYNEVDDEELARIAGSLHHEGICIVTRPRPTWDLDALGAALQSGRPGATLALDRVGNPHNLGAILRSAAYFGNCAVLFAEESGQSQLTPAAVRVAEGGAECVPITVVPTLAGALRSLRTGGVRIVGTDARARQSAFRESFDRPCVVVMGNEREGLSAAVRAQCDVLVAIPGSGEIDSLNASVAAAVLLAQLSR